MLRGVLIGASSRRKPGAIGPDFRRGDGTKIDPDFRRDDGIKMGPDFRRDDGIKMGPDFRRDDGGYMYSTLQEILEYQNPRVIERYKKYHPDSAHRADELFTEMKRFLWGSKKHNFDKLNYPEDPFYDFEYVMDTDMQEIDQMWHVFLLYTRDYMDFCHKYFGAFVHHQPDLAPGMDEKKFDFEANLEKFLNYNYELFGPSVVEKWFYNSFNM